MDEEATSRSPAMSKLPMALAKQFASGRVFDELPSGVYFCDHEGAVVHFNRRAAELWGRVPKIGETDVRFCGAHGLFLLDGRRLRHADTPMAIVLRDGVPVHDKTIVMERPDGMRVTVLVNIDPVFDEDGSLAGAVSCFQDVTELRRAQETLEAKDRQLHALLEALPAAVYTTDAQGRITFFNQAASELAGRSPQLGSDSWCVSWKLYQPDGTPMAHEHCPMAVSLKERRPVRGAEAVAERPDGTRVPFAAYPVPLFDESNQLLGAINMLVDISERKEVEETQQLLISELNHRVKNTLATVQAIANHTLRRARSPSDFAASFSGRLQALSRAHTVLTWCTWLGAQIDDLIRDQLLMGGTDDDRVTYSGPAVLLEPQAALHLALVLHELGTNARKYGALSMPEGTLAVSWDVRNNIRRILRLHWQENGGPRVTAPAERGFGTELIEQSLRGHGGEACLRFEAHGVSCEIELPLPDRVETRRRFGASTQTRSDADPDRMGHAAIQGKRILVIEDEPLIAMDMAANLTAAGCDVVGPAQTLDKAMQLVRNVKVDAALVDTNLGGLPVDELAAALTRQNVPFAFVTGYGRQGLPRAFQDAILIAKPFSPEQLLAAVRQLTQRGGTVSLRSKAL